MAKKPNKRPDGKQKHEVPRQPFAELPPSLQIKKVGRPSKYDPTFCELVLDLGAKGKSKAQMASALGVDRSTLDDWIKTRAEFRVAIAHARDLALAWWEDLGQMNVCRKGFNAQGYAFQMTNRFPADYRNKQEVSGDPERPMIAKIVRTIVDPKGKVYPMPGR